jgi:putative transposase
VGTCRRASAFADAAPSAKGLAIGHRAVGACRRASAFADASLSAGGLAIDIAPWGRAVEGLAIDIAPWGRSAGRPPSWMHPCPLKGWRLTSRRGDVLLKGWRLDIAPWGHSAGRPPSWTLPCPLWHMEDTMRRNKLALFLHLVWATWDRLPLITPDIERRLYRNIESEARKQGCTVLALNGTEDHVHLLVIFPATITIADLLKHVKGVSSRFINETLRPPAQFKWQGSYGAFTVSRWDVARIKEYIKRQKEHHRSGELVPEFEETFEEIKSDE